ncbi:MAG TPA: hypothetical protein VGU71_09645 [Candidatus Dormibacteraeota bacterium]|nr:hypothetical protein [Candidatus Dormibacteraeota bacterium]
MVLDQSQATALLSEAEGARARTRSVLSANWFPMILFGVVALVSVPVAEFWSWTAVAAFWLVGAPLGTLATALWYRSRATEIGVSVNPWPYVVTAVAIVVGCAATGMAGRGGPVSYAGPLLVIGLGYLVFGRLDRSLVGAAFGAAMATVAIIVFAIKPQHVYTLTMLPFGAGSVLLGLWNLRQAKRPD